MDGLACKNWGMARDATTPTAETVPTMKVPKTRKPKSETTLPESTPKPARRAKAAKAVDLAVVAPEGSKGRSVAHRDALAAGRFEARVVRSYLEAIEAHKPKRGRKRTPDSISARLTDIDNGIGDTAGIDRVHLLQQRADLEAELASINAASNLPDLEAAFIDAAASYSARKAISYATWRTIGVAPAVLRAANITR